MLKFVIFDFDGVLINEYSEHYKMNKEWITGLTEEEFLKLFDGNAIKEDIKLNERKTDFNFKRQFSDYKSTILIKEKIKKFLLELSKKYTLGINTSGAEKGTNSSLKFNGIDALFSFVYGSETDMLKTKKFELAMKNFDFNKNECVYVTDTVGDVLEARKVGINSIAVDFGYHGRERLEKSKPLKIVSSFDELRDSIFELN